MTAAPRPAMGPALQPPPLPTAHPSPTFPARSLAALLPVSPLEEAEEQGRHTAEGIRVALTGRNWAELPPNGAFPAFPRKVGARAVQEERSKESAAVTVEGTTPPTLRPRPPLTPAPTCQTGGARMEAPSLQMRS